MNWRQAFDVAKEKAPREGSRVRAIAPIEDEVEVDDVGTVQAVEDDGIFHVQFDSGAEVSFSSEDWWQFLRIV